MKTKNLDILANMFWLRICLLSLSCLFIHLTVVIPVMEFQGVEITISESLGDKEFENEGEELDEVIEHSIDNLLPPIVAQNYRLADLSVNELNSLFNNLFGPPPELI